jgi:hypothetical protein
MANLMYRGRRVSTQRGTFTSFSQGRAEYQGTTRVFLWCTSTPGGAELDACADASKTLCLRRGQGALWAE